MVANCLPLIRRPASKSLHDFVMEVTGGKGAEDVVVSVPIAAVMAESGHPDE